MDEQTLIAELIRWVMGIPADRVTWHHVALVLGGLMVWVLPAAMRIYHFVHHLRFIRSATPEQLAAYTGKLPPPKAPSLGGPVVILGLLLLLVGIARGGVTVAASEESRPECTSDKQCPAGQYCLRGSCVSNARRPKPGGKMAASGPLGLDFEMRDPELPTVDWVQRNL